MPSTDPTLASPKDPTIVAAPAAANVPAAARIESVDALRGLVILLMIFVNDVAGAPRAPAWLKHVSAEADAMTLPDVVFPAFLFIAGMSIPLAFERARAHGATTGQLVRKTLVRAVALLAMGVVMVNQEEMHPGPDASWWQRQWGLAAYIAMFLALAVVPQRAGSARTVLRGARLAGTVALLVLALLYRNGAGQAMVLGPLLNPPDPVWLRHSWWGILGLIGWAYLIAALAYLVIGRRREGLLGAAICLLLLFVASSSDFGTRLAERPWLDGVRPLISAAAALLGWINAHASLGTTLGSLPAITMAGCCLGTVLVEHSASHSSIGQPETPPSDAGVGPSSPNVRPRTAPLRWALAFGGGLLLVGVLTDGAYGINKIRATPAWCCYCAALTTFAWAGLYWLMDLRGMRAWARLVAPAGANPLLAYLLHPLLFLVVGAAGGSVISLVFFYKAASLPATVSVVGSLIMAVLVVQATGWTARAGFRLKV